MLRTKQSQHSKQTQYNKIHLSFPSHFHFYLIQKVTLKNNFSFTLNGIALNFNYFLFLSFLCSLPFQNFCSSLNNFGCILFLCYLYIGIFQKKILSFYFVLFFSLCSFFSLIVFFLSLVSLFFLEWLPWGHQFIYKQ